MSQAGANLNAKVVLTLDANGMVQGADNAVGQLSRVAKAANDAGAGASKTGGAVRQTGEDAQEAGLKLDKLENLLARMGVSGGVAASQIGLLRSALKAIPELIADFPVTSAVGAAVVAIGAVVVASETYQARINDLIVAERVHGNALGLTRQGYIDLAASIADAARVSDREGLKITAGLVGKNSSIEEMKVAAGTVRDLARAMGVDLPAAAAAMRQAVDDPLGALKQLTDAGVDVDYATQRYVKDLIDQGRRQQAGLVVAQEIAKANRGIADEVTRSADAYEHATTAMSGFFDGLAQRLADIPREKIDMLVGIAQILTGHVPAAPKQSQADQAQAKQNEKTRTDAGNYIGGIIDQLDPYGSQLRTLGNERKGVIDKTNAAIAAGADKTKALADQTRALNLIDTESARVKKAQADAALNLNEALKARLEREKSLIAGGPQAIAQAKAQADAQVQIAGHVLDGVGAQQKFADQLEIEKATLPYSTALLTAKGKAAKDLKAIIDALTASMQQGQVAQHAADAANDVQSQFAGMSGQSLTDAERDQQLKDATKSLREWRDSVVSNLKAGRDAGDLTDEAFDKLAAKAQDVFEYQLGNLYLADAQKRKDWASGIALGLNQVEQDTADWATTSKNLITSGADALKTGFFDTILAQRDPLQSFFSWFKQSLAQMVWQSKLAGPANSLVGGLVDLAGKAFGMTIGPSSTVGDVVEAPSFDSVTGAPVAHAGWDVGRGAAPGYRLLPANDNGWATAPRLHTGTGSKTVGDYLAAGEHRVIVQDKERVVTPQQWDDRAGGVSLYQAAPTITVNVVNQSGTPLRGIQGQTKKTGDGFSIDVIVNQVEQKMAGNIHSGSSPVASMLEQTHGLQRRPAG